MIGGPRIKSSPSCVFWFQPHFLKPRDSNTRPVTAHKSIPVSLRIRNFGPEQMPGWGAVASPLLVRALFDPQTPSFQHRRRRNGRILKDTGNLGSFTC